MPGEKITDQAVQRYHGAMELFDLLRSPVFDTPAHANIGEVTIFDFLRACRKTTKS